MNDLEEISAEIREHVEMLKEFGVTELAVKLDVSVRPLAVVEASKSEPPSEFPSALFSRPIPKEESRAKPGSRLASLPSLKEISPSNLVRPATAARSGNSDANAAGVAAANEALAAIRAEIGPDCTRCKLCSLGRNRVVNSVGNPTAELMFVGEAPGADEDAQGEPFVGRAGQLLTKIIEGIGLKRESVFIGNINRCRPPGNRAPEPDETATCRPFLLKEISVVQPKVIVVLGATAAHNLLDTKVPIGKLRGQFHDHFGVKVMPTFHPAYLLRDPNKKREVWEDMKLVRELLNS